MKKFLSIYGITLFLFVTYLFLNDFVSDYSYLYINNFSPIVSTKLLPKYNLSSSLMFFVYIIASIAIILAIKFKKTHIVAIICNLIISIPIFLVHKDTLFFEPFYFMYSYSHCINILIWVWYIYLSIFGGIMLAFYLFINSSKCTSQQKKKIKKIIKIGLISLVSVATIYLTQCLYLSFKTDYLVRTAYETNGKYSQELEDIISEENFKLLSYEGRKDNHSFPMSFVFFKQARSWCWYGNIKLNLHFPKIVSFELKNFKWVVTDVFEYP